MVDSGPATSLPAPVAPLSRPGTYFGRVIVFLILCGIAVAFLQERIVTAFLANPVLNAVIIIALLAGIVLALHALWQIGREVRWANAKLRSAVSSSRLKPYLLGPLEGAFTGAVKSLTPLNQRALLDSFEARLYEGREILRYLAGLLVFLGTFWGLLETVRSIGGVIGTMHTSGSESGALFEDLKSGLAAPLAGMGISFSSSLFGLAGSLVLGFLDLQVGRAHTRFATEVEDRLAQRVSLASEGGELPALQGVFNALTELKQLVGADSSSRATTQAMANLAEGIQALVKHMRSEQQMIRDWVEAQALRERKVERLLDRLASEPVRRE